MTTTPLSADVLVIGWGLAGLVAAAEALNAAAAGLGPLDLPASEDQLLQDVDDLF
jgi:predicted oxidoreductase